MKTIILTAALALSTNAFAFVSFGGNPVDSMPSTQPPSSSQWAIAMTAQACKMDLSSMKGATGTITKTDDGVVYMVSKGGNVIAAASAKSTFILAKKTCLN